MYWILMKIYFIILLENCCSSPIPADTSGGGILPICSNPERNTSIISEYNCANKYSQSLSETILDINFIEKNCNFTKSSNKLKICSNFRSIDTAIFQTLSHIDELYAIHLNIGMLNLTTYNLKLIDLSYNNLKIFNVSLMDNLLHLNVSNNALKSIEMENVGNTYLKLESLDISFNEFSELISFINFPNLKYLNLSQNLIENINSKFFDNYHNLRNLDLSHNRLQTFDLNIFDGLSALNHLDVSFNNVNRINVNVFRPLQKLEAVDLSTNNISSFDFINFVKISANLKSVRFRNNPLNCARIIEMKSHLKSLRINLSASEECQSNETDNFHCCSDNYNSHMKQFTRSHLRITINREPRYHQISSSALTSVNIDSKSFIEKFDQQNSANITEAFNKKNNNIKSKMNDMNSRYEYISLHSKFIGFFIIIIMIPILIKLAVRLKKNLCNDKIQKKIFYH